MWHLLAHKKQGDTVLLNMFEPEVDVRKLETELNTLRVLAGSFPNMFPTSPVFKQEVKLEYDFQPRTTLMNELASKYGTEKFRKDVDGYFTCFFSV